MSIRNQYERGYAAFWRSLANFLKNNTYLHVGGVARAGSRKKGTHHDKSDLDVIFWISGDPSKESVYPYLVDQLKNILNVRADIGSSYNVIKIWKNQISCDLVLLSQYDFQNEVNYNKYEEY